MRRAVKPSAPNRDKCITIIWRCQELLCYSIEIMKMLTLLTFILFAQQPAKLPESSRITEGAGPIVGEQTEGPNNNQRPPINSPARATETVSHQEKTTPTDDNVEIQGKLIALTGWLVVVGFITAG